MQRSRFIPGLTTGLAAAVLVLLCGGSGRSEEARPAKAAVNDSRFHAKLLEIAKGYEAYGRVDAGRRWSPYDCSAPARNPEDPTISRVRFSAAAGEDAHAQKLYSLFAKDRQAYLKPTDKPAAAGTVIVKEAWHPKELTDAEAKSVKVELRPADLRRITGEVEEVLPVARKDGKLYKADKKGDLFIMVKTDATEGTDEGWVYGTVTPDGKTVTSAGQVESCMGCHVKAPHDRLFGLPAAKK